MPRQLRFEAVASPDSEVERYELREPPRYQFTADRREFVQALGAGLVIAVGASRALGQRGGRGGRGRGGFGEGPRFDKFSQRFHIGHDGVVTVMTSKVEVGQGSRTEIAQAAAEELHVPIASVRLIMADTELCPDDGGTAGSRTTPSTIPAVRSAAAAARELLAGAAAKRLGVEVSEVSVADGVFQSKSDAAKRVTLAELAAADGLAEELDAASPASVSVTPVGEWKVLGTSVKKVSGREVVTGAHKYPSDVTRPGMLHGKVLRPPAIGATLTDVDLGPAKELPDVTVVQDGEFVGCTAPTTWQAVKAIEALEKIANWKTKDGQPSSETVFEHFKQTATTQGGGWPFPRSDEWGDGAKEVAAAEKKFSAAYKVAYIQHAPMEPRAAVAEWTDGKLTVWTGSQQPGNVQREACGAFRLPPNKVRIIVPDTGGGFGGKHSGECAVEAARLAKAAGKPVSLRWTREEEFTWAYSRPGGLIEIEAGLDADGKLVAWDMTNYNSGESALGTPYRIANGRTRFLAADTPLRQGSYRALASTANTFARESAMDELAALAGADPIEFRLKHLDDGRLKDALRAAADKFGWTKRYADRDSDRNNNRGVGLACGTEKGSFVAACADVEVNDGKVKVLRICEAFECGAIMNPVNLRAQVSGAIVMGLGGALFEAMKFADGKLSTNRFSEYRVPRMSDLPELDVVLVNRPDLASLGAGETPIIAVAPAIANAIAAACGVRARSLPLSSDDRLKG